MPTPLNLPTTTGFTKSRFEIRRKTGMSTSPFTGVQQVYSHPYALWAAVLTLPPMKVEDAQEWKALFLALRGRSGTFLLGDPDYVSPKGSISGSVILDEAISVNDQTVRIRTTNYSQSDVLKAGDYIQIGEGEDAKLHMVIANCDTDTAGEADVSIEPPVKAEATAGTAVIYNSPKGVFRLEDDVSGWDSNHMKIHGITFSCQEAL